MKRKQDYDVVIVGGGFFGCCLALYLRSIFEHVLVIEREPDLLTQASRVNQARVHAGFHYPRSFVTALRSARLRDRFAREFSDAVVDNFQMLYGVARHRSKVTARRFRSMFSDMKAPFAPAQASDCALFDPNLVEAVFACDEFAFDWTVLQAGLKERLSRHGVDVLVETTVCCVESRDDGCRIILDDSSVVIGQFTFNVTYSGLNGVLIQSGLTPLPLKHELTEVALIVPPPILEGKAITLMDGSFFSTMPYPSLDLYSLTHVRYTPQLSWVDGSNAIPPYAHPNASVQSRWRHMVLDAQRYVPSLAEAEYRSSLFTVKTILTKNELNDGRPILVHRHDGPAELYSVLGGKIDNIYDLFDVLPDLSPVFAEADARFVVGPA